MEAVGLDNMSLQVICMNLPVDIKFVDVEGGQMGKVNLPKLCETLCSSLDFDTLLS